MPLEMGGLGEWNRPEPALRELLVWKQSRILNGGGDLTTSHDCAWGLLSWRSEKVSAGLTLC